MHYFLGLITLLVIISCEPSTKKSDIFSQDVWSAQGTSDSIEFYENSNIEMIELSPIQIENLKVLGKVWGMMKYYHPAIREGRYNWDYELFRIMPEILHAESKEERNRILVYWIKQFGDLPQTVFPVNGYQFNVKIHADLEWIKDKKELGKDLSKLLKRLKRVRRNDANYYMNLDNFSLRNENPYSYMNYPDAGYRLLSLYRFWNIIQYYCPNRHLIGEDWNQVLPECIPLFLYAENAVNYQKTVLKLITRVNDGHTNICQVNIFDSIERGLHIAPIEITFIEKKAIVTDFLNKDVVSKTKLRKGDMITKVNGKTIDSIINERQTITPSSNKPAFFHYIARELLRSKDTLLILEFESGLNNRQVVGTDKNISCDYTSQTDTVQCLPYRLIYDILGSARECIPFKKLTNDIGYVYMGALKCDSVDSMMAAFRNTKGIVIDLRCYPCDYPGHILAEYLIPKPTSVIKWSFPNMKKPGEFLLNKGLKAGKKTTSIYKGKIAILVNEKTQSAAEFYSMMFQVAPHAQVIGSTTAGADGNIISIPFPGNIQTALSSIGVYYPNGEETQRVGIIPDIEIKPTIKGFREGRDEVLEKAIEWISL